MSQHHFIITYDSNSGWSLDIDSESARFPEGTVYINDQWYPPVKLMKEQRYVYARDERAAKLLGEYLLLMNATDIERGE